MLITPHSYSSRGTGNRTCGHWLFLDCSWGLIVSHCGSRSYVKTSSEHQQPHLWKVSLLFLNQEAKVCLLRVSFALHLSFWHMGSRRSLLLTEWKNFTYGLITANYQQREEFSGGQLNPTHGFSERLPRISVLCHVSQWHFAPPQRTTVLRKVHPLVSLCAGNLSQNDSVGSVWLLSLLSQLCALGGAWRGIWQQDQYFLTPDSYPLLIPELRGWCPLWLLSSLSLWQVWTWTDVSSGK